MPTLPAKMRHKFTHEDCVAGGKARAAQESFIDLQRERGRKGFERVSETHPYFVRKHLKHIIKAFNKKKEG